MNRHVARTFFTPAAIIALLLGTLLPTKRAAAETKTWIGGTDDWAIDSNWSPTDGYPDSTTVDVLIDGDDTATNSAVLLDLNADVLSIEIDAGDSLTHENGRSLTVNGNGALNDGTWTLDGSPLSSAATELVFSGPQTLGGSGEVVMSDDAQNTLWAGSNSDALTHSASHTIRGAGRLLSNRGDLINNGTIRATGANNPLTIDPTTTFTNHGTVRAEGAAGLRFGPGTFDLSGTTLEVLDGSRLAVGASATVLNGVLDAGGTTGTGRVIAENGSEFDGVTIAAGSTVNQENGDTVDVLNGLTNNGTWSVNGAGASSSATDLVFKGSQTLEGSGELIMTDDPHNMFWMSSSGNTLTHGPNHTIRGAGRLLNNRGNMVNNGTILATGQSNALTINPTTTFLNSPTGVLGGTGTLEFRDGTLVNNGTIAPGLSTGELTIDGRVENADTSILDIEVAGAGPGDFDRLLTNMEFEVDGLLRVTFLPGAGFLQTSDRLLVVDSAALIGGTAFDATQHVNTGYCDVDYDPVNGDIFLTNFRDTQTQPIPEPATVGLLALGCAAIGAAIRRRRRGSKGFRSCK
mgnify:CR=1 FL=1